MRSVQFLTTHRKVSSLLGALLAGLVLVSIAAPDALAGSSWLVRPPAPSIHKGTPHFVTETNDKKWDDCSWAAAVMLIEHWTGERVDRRDLRAASGNLKGGSSLRDVARGVAALTRLDLRYSPDGGDPMTWRQLLNRLANGGGAEVQGAYSNLPSWYTRWDRKFAASGPVKSAHAVYVERYEPKRGRVWLMDPLGRGDYNGEWISVQALHAFVYERHGLVVAAATPAPIPDARLSSVEFGQPALSSAVAGQPATVTIQIAHDRKSPPHLAALRVTTSWQAVDAAQPDGPVTASPSTALPALAPSFAVPSGLQSLDALPDGPGAGVQAPPPPIVTGNPSGTRLVAKGWALTASVTVPTEPGRYLLTVTLRNSAGKAIGARMVKPFNPTIVSVGGPYRVRYKTSATLLFGAQTATIGVTNIGTALWALVAGSPTSVPAGGPGSVGPRLAADWVHADGSTTAAGGAYLTLKPGASTSVGLQLSPMPSDAVGLRLDLIDPSGGRVSDEGGRAVVIAIAPQAPLVRQVI